MKIDWREFCRAADFALHAEGVEVRFQTNRTQKVTVEDHGEVFLLRSIAARAAAVGEIPDAALRAWVRNRSVALVGFRVDDRGRMIGEAWVPKPAALMADEFQLVLRHVAAECDRFEFQLTGQDQE